LLGDRAFQGYTLLRCKVEVIVDTNCACIRYARLPIVGDSLYRGAPLWLSDLKRGYRLKPNERKSL
jgi:hypothetical protein